MRMAKQSRKKQNLHPEKRKKKVSFDFVLDNSPRYFEMTEQKKKKIGRNNNEIIKNNLNKIPLDLFQIFPPRNENGCAGGRHTTR